MRSEMEMHTHIPRILCFCSLMMWWTELWMMMRVTEEATVISHYPVRPTLSWPIPLSLGEEWGESGLSVGEVGTQTCSFSPCLHLLMHLPLPPGLCHGGMYMRAPGSFRHSWTPCLSGQARTTSWTFSQK